MPCCTKEWGKKGLKKEDVTGSCVLGKVPLATADAGHQEAYSPTSLLEVHRFHGESQGHPDEEIGELQPAGVADLARCFHVERGVHPGAN
jgi:hypothetical protein